MRYYESKLNVFVGNEFELDMMNTEDQVSDKVGIV
jgi:hypothetical protein